uniref:Glycosyltransferase n=1 Tax=Strongyloides venezuelensis TaxID=75913 RepID=A0A0K0FQN8_STRVS
MTTILLRKIRKKPLTFILPFLVCGVIIFAYLSVTNNSIDEEYIAYLDKGKQMNKKYTYKPKIAIIIVVENKKHMDNYKLALTSLECYAIGLNYIFKTIDFEETKNLSLLCPQEDFFFARHCGVGKYLEDHKESIDFGVVLDGDIGVINPYNFLENYLPKNKNEHIILTQRLFTHEIAASPYIVRNSDEGRKFLYEWSEFFYRIPSNFHGSDNGAIMQLFLYKFGANSSAEELNRCYDLYEHIQKWPMFRSYTICVISILYRNSMIKNDDDDLTFGNGSIKILRRVPFRSFVRDIWDTGSKISPKDFFVHGLKQSNMGKKVLFGHWDNPLNINWFDLKKCSSPDFTKQWEIKKNFLVDTSAVYSKLSAVQLRVEKEYRDSVYSKSLPYKHTPIIDNNIYISSVFENEKDETKVILFTMSSQSKRKLPFDGVQKLEGYRFEDQLKFSYSSYQGKILESQSSENIFSQYMSDKINHRNFVLIPRDKNIEGFSVCSPILFNFPNLGKMIHFFKYWKSQGASLFIIYYHSWTLEINDFINDMKNDLNIEIVPWSNLPFNPEKSKYTNPNFQTNYHFQRLAELDCIYRSRNKVKFVIQPQLLHELDVGNLNDFLSQMSEMHPDASGFRFPIYSKTITNMDDFNNKTILLKINKRDMFNINEMSVIAYNTVSSDLDNIKEYIVDIDSEQHFAYQIGYQNILIKSKNNKTYSDWVVPLRHWSREDWKVAQNSWLVI